MNRFPSRRPKVSEVKNWCVVFSHKVDRTWKVNQPQSVTIQRADPFWDFYRVRYVNHTTGDRLASYSMASPHTLRCSGM